VASGASRQDVSVDALFMEVPMKQSVLVPFKFLKSLAAPHLHDVLVVVTGNKFIAGINDTPAIAENL
jgi:hypothetical protein